MNLLVCVAAALPMAATYLLLQPARRAGASRVCTVALAIGIGLGIGSCTFFLALVLFDGRRAGVIGIDAALLVLALAVWRRSEALPAAPRAPLLSARAAGLVSARAAGLVGARAAGLSSSERVLAVALVVAAAAGATSFLANTVDAPHGRWDAWVTWNMRARWLADGYPAWLDAFARPNMQRDYPLLLPCTVARLWVYADAKDPVVPAVVAAAYGTAVVLLLYAGLAALRGRAQALIGALCLLGTPLFLRLVPWQYADAPLAFNLLAAVTLLSLYDRDPPRGRTMLVWAGLATGLVAWTKNEGMMIALGIVVVRGALMIVRRSPGMRSSGWFAAGLLPPAASVLYFKLTLAPRSPQLTLPMEAMIGKLADPGRYVAVLRSAAYELARGTGPVLLALVVYAFLLGRTPDRRARGMAAAIVPIIGFATLSYGYAYVTTRAPLPWMLGNSMERLILQIWPSVLLAVLLYVASPSERDAPAPMRAPAGRQPAKPARRRGRAGRR